MVKRIFDVIVSLAGLTVLSPFFLLVAILIKLDSRGPVFYGGKRVGYKGEIFTMYKFRTMAADADSRGPAVTYDSDPRITRVGNLLRRARLDEFPQLWNVLRGDMSLVGPRPESIYYFEMYSERQKQIFRAKPGITGLSQVIILNEDEWLNNPETLDQDYMEKVLPPKVELDLEYAEKQSLRADLYIIGQTFWVIFKDKFIERSKLPETAPTNVLK